LFSIDSSGTPNGCGSASFPSNLINFANPQFSFELAGNNHDTCYESGISNNFCDAVFDFEKKEIIRI
jgi:hypothetical protein